MQQFGGLPRRVMSALRLLPAGGTINQVLKKSSASDYDVTWQNDDVVLADPKNLQSSLSEALSRHVPLYLPAGVWNTATLTTGAATWVAICGSGQATVTNGLHLGPGVGGSGSRPSGWLRDLVIDGGGLILDGLRGFDVNRVDVKNTDIAYDFINNCFGARLSNCWAGKFGGVNVGINLREGTQSGNDITFNDCWISGETAAIHVSGGNTNFRFRGGQLACQPASSDDSKGVVIFNKDYATQAVGAGCGILHFQDVDFENISNCWAFRGFGTGAGGQMGPIRVQSCTIFAKVPSDPGIGFAKFEGAGSWNMLLEGNVFSGTFTNPQMMIAPTGSAFFVEESGSTAYSLVVNGETISGNFRSVVEQSGLLARAIVKYANAGAAVLKLAGRTL